MKTFSASLTAAMTADPASPIWLVRFDLVGPPGSATLYLADRPYRLGGVDWRPAVLAWGAVDRYFDPDTEETALSDVTVVFSNRQGEGGEPNLSWYLRAYDTAASTATLYLWFDGVGLTEPVGELLNDLLPIVTGRPEIADEITPSVCPVDIVAPSGPAAGGRSDWGDLLRGRYTRNQWPALPSATVGAMKPMALGDGVTATGVPLVSPTRIGRLTGPAGLFDPVVGAETLEIAFPDAGVASADSPYPAPCEIFVGDWRFSIRRAPEKRGAVWVYYPDTRFVGDRRYYLPNPLLGASPLFAPSPDAFWPTASALGAGPFGASEPAKGMPYQLHHGVADAGAAADGRRPGRFTATVTNLAVEGVAVDSTGYFHDRSFGVVWLRPEGASVVGKLANPATIRLKFTAVDPVATSGETWLGPERLTARWPRGYNAAENPCLLGNFTVPASGGGAPTTTKLGLVNAPRYPLIGARVAAIRLVIRYTGVEFSGNATFHVKSFGVERSFSAAQLVDGAGIADAGWRVILIGRGGAHDIWPDNLGYPLNLATPQPRDWDVYELSIDVTADTVAAVEEQGGFADRFAAWFSGSVWPDLASMIVLEAGLEVDYDAAAAALAPPRVTATLSTGHATVGAIAAALIPAESVGTGFDDPTLPALKYYVDKQVATSRFVAGILREADAELAVDPATGRYNLVRRSLLRDPAHPPAPPTTGVGAIDQASLLADADGAPLIRRTRNLPDSIVNEVTLRYVREDGARRSVTERNEGSVAVHGLRPAEKTLGAAMTDEEAAALAKRLLAEKSEPRDYYSLTFPLGAALAFEPGDIIGLTADMDRLDRVAMRVAAVALDPGSPADARPATVTLHAQRYAAVRLGFGRLPFGQTPFGQPSTVEN